MPRRKATAQSRVALTQAGIEAMSGHTIEEVVHENHGGLTFRFESGLVTTVFADLGNDMVVDIEEEPAGLPIHGEPADPDEAEGWEAEASTDEDEWEDPDDEDEWSGHEEA